MKCEFCGANIDIETPVCPYCGMEKKQFDIHRTDMKAFKNEFDTIKEEVVEENKRFSKKASYITIIAVLITINLVLILCTLMNWDIYKYFLKKKLNAHAREYAQQLEILEKNEEYEQISCLFSDVNLHYIDDNPYIEEYKLLYRFCAQYESFVTYLPTVSMMGYAPDLDHRYDYRIDTVVETYNTAVDIYNRNVIDRENTYYSEATYNEQHLKSYETIVENMEAMIQTYCNFDDDQMEQFNNKSQAYQSLMIEEAMKKESTDNEE